MPLGLSDWAMAEAQAESQTMAQVQTMAYRAAVISIVDGDTIRVLQGRKQRSIRLACIDAAEMAQVPDGPRARDHLQTRLRIGSMVWVQPHGLDPQGRTVAEVIGEINLNLAMVEDGHAFVARPHPRLCDAREYLEAEYRACRSRYGVWQQPGGILRPWEFRRGHRSRVAGDQQDCGERT